MPHLRISTASPATQVKLTIDQVLFNYVQEHGPLGYRETYTYSNPETGTTIIFHGHGSLVHAYARYEGVYGVWEINLSDGHGRLTRTASLEELKADRVSRTCGKPWEERA